MLLKNKNVLITIVSQGIGESALKNFVRMVQMFMH